MRYYYRFLLAMLMVGGPIALSAQLPALFGIQKITTYDPDTFLVAGNTVIVNGTDTIGFWDPDQNDNFYSVVEVDPSTGQLLKQTLMDSAKGVDVVCATYDAWNKDYVFLSENLYPGAGQFYYSPNVPTFRYVHKASVTGTTTDRKTIAEAGYHIEPQYDAQKQKIYGITTALSPSNAFNFVEIDPATGGMTKIMDIPELQGPARGTSTYDSNHGDYYLIGLGDSPGATLFKINADSMTVETQLVTPTDVWLDLEYDNNLDRLFGIRGQNILDSMEIREINFTNGSSVVIKDIPPYQTKGTATYEYASNIYLFTSGAYFYGTEPRIMGVNVITGNIVLDTVMQDWVYELQCDNSEFVQTKYGPVTAVEEALNPVDWTVYPNPTAGTVKLQFPGSEAWEVAVYDVRGGKILSRQGLGETQELDLERFDTGVYFVTGTQNGQLFSQKIILR